jgi:hypothetical protein
MPKTDGFRFHNLPEPVLRLLVRMMEALKNQPYFVSKIRGKNAVACEKVKWAMGQIAALLDVKSHPRCLVRRKDFVPTRDYDDHWKKLEILRLAFGDELDDVTWLVSEIPLPPTQLVPGASLSTISHHAVLAAFARNLQHHGRVSIRLGPKLREFTAWAETPKLVRLENPGQDLGASHFKGHLAWIADSQAIADLLQELPPGQTGPGVFSRIFPSGTLHVVKSSSVDNAKFVLQPPLSPDAELVYSAATLVDDPVVPPNRKLTIVMLGSAMEVFWAGTLVVTRWKHRQSRDTQCFSFHGILASQGSRVPYLLHCS